jgi:hypothetical protein
METVCRLGRCLINHQKKPIVVKKFLSVAAVLTLISFFSCRSGEDCPAYGKIEVEQVGENC